MSKARRVVDHAVKTHQYSEADGELMVMAAVHRMS